MRPTHHLEFLTPKKVTLQGLWFGPRNASRVVIWVHGLGSTLFSKLSIADEIVDRDTAVLAFNNRGHDKIARFSQGRRRRYGGSAHEIFSECVDDIEGAIRVARAAGATDMFVAGHSTGCQKSVYWAAKKGTGVKGIILLAPISDYAAEVHARGKAVLARHAQAARQMVRTGKSQMLMPALRGNEYLFTDAQRFLSLYSGMSEEEIFTYWAPERVPTTLHKVTLPVLVLLAEKDEYRDRPAVKMADWFREHLKHRDRVVLLKGLKHSFKGGEKAVAQYMHRFMKGTSQ